MKKALYLILIILISSSVDSSFSKKSVKLDRIDNIRILFSEFSLESFVALDEDMFKDQNDLYIIKLLYNNRLYHLKYLLSDIKPQQNKMKDVRILVEFYIKNKLVHTLSFNNHYMHFDKNPIKYSCEIRKEVLMLCDYWKYFSKEKKIPCDSKN